MDLEINSFPGLLLMFSDAMADCPFLEMVEWSQVKSTEATTSFELFLSIMLAQRQMHRALREQN